MEQNQNQTKQNKDMKQGKDNEQMQHRSDVVQHNTDNGNDNPQDGSEWSNYRGRSLSSNADNQNKQDK